MQKCVTEINTRELLDSVTLLSTPSGAATVSTPAANLVKYVQNNCPACLNLAPVFEEACLTWTKKCPGKVGFYSVNITEHPTFAEHIETIPRIEAFPKTQPSFLVPIIPSKPERSEIFTKASDTVEAKVGRKDKSKFTRELIRLLDKSTQDYARTKLTATLQTLLQEPSNS